MNEISFVIPSYNNLRYLKNAYRSIRTHCGDERHEIIVLDDASSDGTIEWLRSLEDENLTIWENTTGERMGHTITYNIGAHIAKNPIFSILHADMFVGPNYVKNILKHLDKGKVVSATRIEPPLHPSGKEKITKDFGMWPEDFREQDFLTFVEQEQTESKDKTTRGIFAPWAMYREDFLSIGGHDPIFAPFPYEDSDIFQRFILAGYEIIQSRDSLVYHLTCRGHKWTDDKEIGKVDDSFALAEIKARKNYIRKWNSWISNDEYGHPILYPKYNIGIVIENCSSQILEILEPWCSTIYVDCDIENYIKKEQPISGYNLTERIFLTKLTKDFNNDVLIYLDARKFTSEDFENITKMNLILHDIENESNVGGNYELGNLYIRVHRLKNILEELIKC